MPFRLPKRLAHRGDATVIGTYRFSSHTLSSHTVRVLRTSDARIEWTCDCEKFIGQSRRRTTPLWCKHIAQAAARRSLERLTARRLGLPAADGPLTPR